MFRRGFIDELACDVSGRQPASVGFEVADCVAGWRWSSRGAGDRRGLLIRVCVGAEPHRPGGMHESKRTREARCRIAGPATRVTGCGRGRGRDHNEQVILASWTRLYLTKEASRRGREVESTRAGQGRRCTDGDHRMEVQGGGWMGRL